MTKNNWQAVTSVMSLTDDEAGLLDSVQASLQFSDSKMLKLLILISTHRYVTEGSFDVYMWQTLETKAASSSGS